MSPHRARSGTGGEGITTLTLWTGDFARRMRTTAETLSRWEHGRASVGAADDGPARPGRLHIARGPKGWKFRPGPAAVGAAG